MSQTVDLRSRNSQSGSGPGSGGRVPPHNLQAEESLLGAMLLSQEAIVPAVESCSGSDFYKPAHRHVFEAIVSLWGRGEPADPVTVSDELSRADLLEAIGGPAVLVSLQANTPATSNAGRYARIVEEHALLRKLIGVAGEIAEMGYSVPDDVVATVDHAESMMFEVAQRRVSDTMAPIRELLVQSLDRLEALYDRGESITGVPTGFVDLDERLSGLQPSALVIVGARPAMGKCVAWDTPIVDPTTGAIYTAAELHRRGKSGEIVDVFSLDHSHQLQSAQPSAFVDDGIKPVFSVRTRLGRCVRTTLSHPFLTPDGWQPLGKLAVGQDIAVPKRLDVFGIEAQPEHELAMLAYLLSAGTMDFEMPTVHAGGPDVAEEAAALGCRMGARSLRSESKTGYQVTFAARTDLTNPVVELLRRHGLLSCSTSEREVPSVVFQLPREQLAGFLKRMFSANAQVVCSAEGSAYFQWSAVSSRLASQAQHLLLRFGINAELRESNHRWLLSIVEPAELMRFSREIGIMDGQAELEAIATSATKSFASSAKVTSEPVLVGAGANGPAESTTTAPTLWESAAAYLADDVQPNLPGDADVLWDPIVAIDYCGEEQVYDLTIPVHHNFVAADVLVHNTAFALNLAAHAALSGTKVLYFSLEMSHLEITQRLLCAEARVDASRLRNGRLLDTDWPKINHAIGRLGEAPIFIDDNPNITVMDIRAKARRLKAGSDGLGLVIIDYLQLMSGRSSAENRQVEVSEMSRGLKILARELNVPVVALSQLSRNLEMRADKRPVLADLRESGCLVAATRITRADTGEDTTIGALYQSGETDVPVWTLDDQWKLSVGTMTHAFSSGVKEVYRMTLASGRKIEATGNHPFRTLERWSPLDQLQVGTRIAVPTQIHEPQRLTRWSNQEVVMLAHLLYSTAFTTEPNVRYSHSSESNATAVRQAAAAFRVAPVAVTLPSRRDVYFAATDGKGINLASWVTNTGVTRSKAARRLPRDVFALPTHQVRLFVRHLLGEVAECTEQSVRCRLQSKGLAEDTQALLWRLGIDASLGRLANGDTAVEISTSEALAVLADQVGVHGVEDHDLALIAKNSSQSLDHDAIPGTVRSQLTDAMEQADVKYSEVLSILGPRGEVSARQRLADIADIAKSKELRQLAEADVAWDVVVDIEAIGPQPVFDATVLGTHNFVANGIVVHNSLEQDADVVMFLYRDEVYNAESPDKGTAEILVSKHRNGPVGTTQLAFIDRYTRFANMARV